MRMTCLRAGLLAAAVTVLAATPAAAKPDKPVKVSANGDAGWQFARDPANATPYSFSLAERTIGGGSLFVEPISATPAHKFIAEQPMNSPVSDLQSISYDFLIAGTGAASDEDDFYLNVYAFYPTPVNTFFDCRYDYVPSTGSTTAWTTASFAATDTPAHVQTRNVSTPTCPATLAGMPAGSTISFFALNVGQTNAADAGLAGYLDNVVVTQSTGTTTFDFDPTAEACKKGGFAAGGYKNQGACVSAVNG
jgi:hypothetical protein